MDHNPTLLKTVSWLAVSFVMIAACGYVACHDLWTACIASAIATPVKVVVYGLHEHIWGKFIFRKSKSRPVTGGLVINDKTF